MKRDRGDKTFFKFCGEVKSVADWSKIIHLSVEDILTRVASGEDPEVIIANNISTKKSMLEVTDIISKNAQKEMEGNTMAKKNKKNKTPKEVPVEDIVEAVEVDLSMEFEDEEFEDAPEPPQVVAKETVVEEAEDNVEEDIEEAPEPPQVVAKETVVEEAEVEEDIEEDIEEELEEDIEEAPEPPQVVAKETVVEEAEDNVEDEFEDIPEPPKVVSATFSPNKGQKKKPAGNAKATGTASKKPSKKKKAVKKEEIENAQFPKRKVKPAFRKNDEFIHTTLPCKIDDVDITLVMKKSKAIRAFLCTEDEYLNACDLKEEKYSITFESESSFDERMSKEILRRVNVEYKLKVATEKPNGEKVGARTLGLNVIKGLSAKLKTKVATV